MWRPGRLRRARASAATSTRPTAWRRPAGPPARPRLARRATSPAHSCLRGPQVRAAELQARRHPLHLAAHEQRFLGEAHIGQRPRVGGLAPLHQIGQQHIEQRACARVVGRRTHSPRRQRAAAARGSARCPAVSPPGRPAPRSQKPAPARCGTPVPQLAPQRSGWRQHPPHVGQPMASSSAHTAASVQSRTILGMRASGEPHARVGPGVGHVDQRCRSRCTAASPGRPSCARRRSPACRWPRSHRSPGPAGRRSSRTPGCPGTCRAGSRRRW